MTARLPLVLVLLAAASGSALLAVRCDLGAADASALTRDGDVVAAGAPRVLPQAAEPVPEPSLQGRAAEVPVAPRPTGVRVRVISLTGRPVPGWHVFARWTTGDAEAKARDGGRTDVDGVACLDGVPHDGTARVTVWAPGDEPPDVRDDDPAVTGPTLEVRLVHVLEASLTCVDAESGRELDGGPYGLWFDGATHGDLVAARPGEGCSVEPYVAAPAGYVAWDDADWTVGIGRWTRELLAVYPLRREAEAVVSVLDHRGRLEPVAAIDRFTVAGRRVRGQHAEPAGTGRFRLRGVAFLRDEPLVVYATAPYLLYPIVEQVALPTHPADRTDLAVVLPAPGSQAERDNSFIGTGGSSSSRFCCGRGTFRRGGLEIRVLRHDGTPASGATIKVGRRRHVLDAQGVFHAASYRTGRWTVRTQTIGLLPVAGTVEVREGETARIVLHEPKGGALEVRVADADGQPVPFAELYVTQPSTMPWVDEHDGVQRVDPFTDHRGRRRLERVEGGEVELSARWGTRRGSVKVEVREDDVTRATVVVR